jgi:hypothetical protein
MNRYRKTGTYIKPENGVVGEEVARPTRPEGMTVDAAEPDYGGENDYGDDYEGGEFEGIIDPEAEANL